MPISSRRVQRLRSTERYHMLIEAMEKWLIRGITLYWLVIQVRKDGGI
ncbi:hypothetical protein IH992_15745 [Candidatus Poribacteria bacterium]|nr:hypothetical protein [Candidatus Poribacteria bacterium]